MVRREQRRSCWGRDSMTRCARSPNEVATERGAIPSPPIAELDLELQAGGALPAAQLCARGGRGLPARRPGLELDQRARCEHGRRRDPKVRGHFQRVGEQPAGDALRRRPQPGERCTCSPILPGLCVGAREHARSGAGSACEQRRPAGMLLRPAPPTTAPSVGHRGAIARARCPHPRWSPSRIRSASVGEEVVPRRPFLTPRCRGRASGPRPSRGGGVVLATGSIYLITTILAFGEHDPLTER